MADEKSTISQIKIGDTFYNIRDAQVREVLNNITDNVVTVHNFYCADWNSNWSLSLDNDLKNKSANRAGDPANPAEEKWYASSNRCALRIYINNDDNKLYRRYGKVTNDNGLQWTTEAEGLVNNTPSTVNQCAIILQYAFTVRMPKAGCLSSQILRRKINTKSAAGLGTNEYCYIQSASKKTSVKIGDFNSTLYGNNSFSDRIIRREELGPDHVNGYDYQLAINNYKPLTAGTTSQFTGICSTQLLIVQGNSITKLIPEEEIISPSGPETIDDSPSS